MTPFGGCSYIGTVEPLNPQSPIPASGLGARSVNAAARRISTGGGRLGLGMGSVGWVLGFSASGWDLGFRVFRLVVKDLECGDLRRNGADVQATGLRGLGFWVFGLGLYEVPGSRNRCMFSRRLV